MKMNCSVKPARILRHFGQAPLIERADGKHELVGGSEGEYTEAKEWVSLFAHEIVFSQPMKGRLDFALAPSRSVNSRDKAECAAVIFSFSSLDRTANGSSAKPRGAFAAGPLSKSPLA